HFYRPLSLILRHPHAATRFPYTTLFRSMKCAGWCPLPPAAVIASSQHWCRRPPMVTWPKPPSRKALPPARATSSPCSASHPMPRSEEHTSELQSRENLVCRLLLEKKKIT